MRGNFSLLLPPDDAAEQSIRSTEGPRNYKLSNTIFEIKMTFKNPFLLLIHVFPRQHLCRTSVLLLKYSAKLSSVPPSKGDYCTALAKKFAITHPQSPKQSQVQHAHAHTRRMSMSFSAPLLLQK